MGTLKEWNQQIDIANKSLLSRRIERQVPWVKEIHQDLEKFGTKEGDIENREVFRNNCGLWRIYTRIFLEEQCANGSQSMKQYRWKRNSESGASCVIVNHENNKLLGN